MKKSIFLFSCLLIGAMLNAQKEPVKPLNQQGVGQTLPTPHLIQPQIITKIAFEAVVNTAQSSPRSPLRFDGVAYNDGNSFSNNTFTAPTTGLYFFSVNLTWNGYGCGYASGGSVSVTVLKNGRESLQSINQPAASSTAGAFNTALAFSAKLNAGDKVSVIFVNILCDAAGGAGSVPILMRANFNGYRVYAD